MKKYSKYIKFVLKYLVLAILIYNISYKIFSSIKIIKKSQKCEATIVEFGTLPGLFDSLYIKEVDIDFYFNGRWYKTGEVNIDKGGRYKTRYRFYEDESWMKIGDKIEVWVNENDPEDIHYINFKSMIIWTIISVGYSIFIVVDIIVKRKRKKLTS